jgi:hypothetical protein
LGRGFVFGCGLGDFFAFAAFFRGDVFDGDRDGDGYGFSGVEDSGGAVGINLGERTEEQTADVSENGGTARGDAVLGEELEEVHEGMVDALGGLEGLEIAAEVGEVIGGFFLELLRTMLGTEDRTWIRDREAATTATGGAMGATNGNNNGVTSL